MGMVTSTFLTESDSEVAQSCLTPCDPMDGSLPGSSIHGMFQARVLEWAAISFSRGSSRPSDQTWVVPHCRQTLPPEPLGKLKPQVKKCKVPGAGLMVEGPLVPRSMELPGLHIHLLKGSLARHPGREGLLSSCPRSQRRSSPKKQRVKTWGPFSSVMGAMTVLNYNNITSQSLGVIADDGHAQQP